LSLPFPTENIKEGSVRTLVPTLKKPHTHVPSKLPVFYNPRMELNRDVAVVSLRAYQKMVGRSLSVCDPMAGCGVRGIRFATEVSGIERVVMNDLTPEASKLAIFNVKRNRLSNRITVENMDANLLLSLHSSPGRRFDFIDVDPFGSPSPFLDSAVRATVDGGLIALTATDTAPLCGVRPKACLRKYFGKPLRTEYCHELAVRLLISCLAITAARHGLGIKVLFCHSTNHYIRVYARVVRSKSGANETLENIGYILHCFNCFHRELSPGIASILKSKCDECDHRLSVAGPLWLKNLFSKKFFYIMLQEVENAGLGEKKRLARLLNTISAEIDATPTYYVIDKISDRFGLQTPPKKRILTALINLGYQASPTHFNYRGIKTNASAKLVKNIIEQASRVPSNSSNLEVQHKEA